MAPGSVKSQAFNFDGGEINIVAQAVPSDQEVLYRDARSLVALQEYEAMATIYDGHL